jgi:DNA-binding MarR family transcriptional regulator
MRPTECIFFQITKASQNAVRFFSQRVTPLGVTAVQALVLLFLFEQDSITSKELGERAQLDSATLTGIIDRLEGQGLVVRAGNPDDRRAISVRLTEVGREIAAKVAQLSEEANREFLRDLSPEDQLKLRGLLSVVREIG